MLTDDIKEKLINLVNSTEIDVEDLESFSYDGNPYGLEYPLSRGSGEADWDENEEMCAKFDRVIDDIYDEGISEYIDIDPDLDEYGDLTEDAVNYLKKEKENYE